MKKILILCSVAVLVFLSACVSKSDYQTLEQNVSNLRDDLLQLEEAYSSISSELSETQDELAAIKTDYEAALVNQQGKNADYDLMWSLYSKATNIPQEVYTTPASDNNMAGAGWLLEGDITEISSFSGYSYVVVRNKVGDFALFEISSFPEDWEVGDHILVHISYLGYSSVLDLPVGYYTGFYILSKEDRPQ